MWASASAPVASPAIHNARAAQRGKPASKKTVPRALVAGAGSGAPDLRPAISVRAEGPLGRQRNAKTQASNPNTHLVPRKIRHITRAMHAKHAASAFLSTPLWYSAPHEEQGMARTSARTAARKRHSHSQHLPNATAHPRLWPWRGRAVCNARNPPHRPHPPDHPTAKLI